MYGFKSSKPWLCEAIAFPGSLVCYLHEDEYFAIFNLQRLGNLSLAQLSPTNPIRGLPLPLDALIESRLTPLKDLWQDQNTMIFGNHAVWVL